MEILLSIGTLAIGMSFIAGVFPVAIYYATVSTERTMAAVVADEAFVKIRLCRINPADPNLTDTGLVAIEEVSSIGANEFFYPSTSEPPEKKQYSWSALCRRVGPRDVQVTVFVCRKTGSGRIYRNPRNPFDIGDAISKPLPVAVGVQRFSIDELEINDSGKESFINDGYRIVDGRTGDMYRVLERYADAPNRIKLDRVWQSSGTWPRSVWVVPAPYMGGRYPCVGIYQKVMGFYRLPTVPRRR